MGTGQLGEQIGVGRTSDVFAWGSDSVVKVPYPNLPADWTVFEAEIARSIHAAGLPVPEVRDVIEIEGRPAAVFERIDGPSMWQRILERPGDVEAMARELADIQRSLLAAGIPEGVPDFVDRLMRRIAVAAPLGVSQRDEAIDRAEQLPRGASLLHGDLHPGNVLMSADGPVVIDWFDAAIGHPVADIVRSSILLRPGSGQAPGHLPGASIELLDRFHQAYVDEFRDELELAAPKLSDWQAVVAAGRLAEGAEVDERWLIQLWEAREQPRAAGISISSTTGR